MKKLLRSLLGGIAFVALLVVLFVWYFARSNSDIEAYCAGVKKNTSVNAVATEAEKRGWHVVKGKYGMLVTTAGNFGRGVCRVDSAHGKVSGATMMFSD